MKKQLNVVAAILRHNGQTLAVQRGVTKFEYVSYKWEFPGGKVEQGESLVDAIKREITEELNIEVNQPKWLTTIEHAYPDFDIQLHCFICNVTQKEVELTEHIAKKWLNNDELMSLDWAPADIPAVQCLQRHLS